MKLKDILNILNNENIVIDFLGYNETEKIIQRIQNNPKLIEQIEMIDDMFWEEAKTQGLLMYSDWIKNSAFQEPFGERLIAKHQSYSTNPKEIKKKKNMPALVYEEERIELPNGEMPKVFKKRIK